MGNIVSPLTVLSRLAYGYRLLNYVSTVQNEVIQISKHPLLSSRMTTTNNEPGHTSSSFKSYLVSPYMFVKFRKPGFSH